MRFVSVLFLCIFFSQFALADGARIYSMSVYDEGALGGSDLFRASVDTIQKDCDDSDESIQLEPFFDTFLGINVENTFNQEIYFTRFRYKLRYRGENGRRKRSRARRLGIVSGLIIPGNGERSEVLVPLFKARNGRKFIGKSDLILPVDAGFSRLRIRLIGHTEGGTRVSLRAKMTLSISAFDRC